MKLELLHFFFILFIYLIYLSIYFNNVLETYITNLVWFKVRAVITFASLESLQSQAERDFT